MIWGLLAASAVADHPVTVNAHDFVVFRDIDSEYKGYTSRVDTHSVGGAVEAVIEPAVMERDGLPNRNGYIPVHSVREDNSS